PHSLPGNATAVSRHSLPSRERVETQRLISLQLVHLGGGQCYSLGHRTLAGGIATLRGQSRALSNYRLEQGFGLQKRIGPPAGSDPPRLERKDQFTMRRDKR